MRKRFMVIFIVLGVLFAPAFAFANDGFEGSGGGDFSDQVIYGPNVLDIHSGTYGVQVYAGNKFNAALCVLGFDGNDSRFTNDVKAYLSNESTGGSFYEFSNLFTNNNSPNIGGFDIYNITFTSAIGTNNTLYGAEFVWIARYNDTLRQAAYARVEEVLAGNIGSGGGGGTTGNTFTLPIWAGKFQNQQPNWNGARIYEIGGVQYWNFTPDVNYEIAEPVTLSLDSQLTQYLTDFLASGGTTILEGQSQDGVNSYFFYLKHYDEGITIEPHTVVVYKHGVESNMYGYYNYTSQEQKNYQYIRFRATRGQNDTHFVADTGQTYNMGNDISRAGNTYRVVPIHFAIDVGHDSGGGAPVVPPTQWPEPDPVIPTEPPEVPDPPSSDPVSDPTNVNIGIPQLPNIGLTIEPTYGTADLSAVLDAMAKHCQHLQTCMTKCFDSYYSSITQFEKSLQENTKEFQRSWFRVMLDTIRDCFDDLNDYLQRLFTWLADQMDFTFTGGDFDDSSIVWWLKRIYSKLGSGTTVRPTDPVVDPTGIGDWFDQLIKNFVLDLLALGQDFLADVVEMFRQLTTKFPISIPWDIVAILTLFAAEPETPVLNIPQYALTGVNTISQVGTYVIDMQDYDGVMSVVRNVEKVVFAFWLCWKIDFFKQAFDIMTGGK